MDERGLTRGVFGTLRFLDQFGIISIYNTSFAAAIISFRIMKGTVSDGEVRRNTPGAGVPLHRFAPHARSRNILGPVARGGADETKRPMQTLGQDSVTGKRKWAK